MSYIIQPGDTLYKIAKRTVGDGDRWNELWSHNMLHLRGASHELIYPGEVLEPPAGWPALSGTPSAEAKPAGENL